MCWLVFVVEGIELPNQEKSERSQKRKLAFGHHQTSGGAAEYTNYISEEGSVSSNAGPEYNTKQSDGVASTMLKLCGMKIIRSLPSLPGPLWTGVVAPDGPIFVQIELFDIQTKYVETVFPLTETKQMTYAKLNCLK